MLTIYRRHIKSCEHRHEGRKYRRCHCPIWVDGLLGDEEIRKSLKLRDWQKAQDRIREWEADGQQRELQPAAAKTLEEAWDSFLKDAEARNLKKPSLDKYRTLRRQMSAFAQAEGRLRMNDFEDLETLQRFRASWTNKNLSALKKLELLRTFFRFAHDNGWIATNPAQKLRSPKVTIRPTMPFSRDEMIRILAAFEKYGEAGSRKVRRLQALVLLLRYAGLRIQDGVTLARTRITGDVLFLYTSKAGVPVRLPLPPFVIYALDAAASATDPFYFWTGESKPKTAISHYQCELKKLFKLAGIPGGHAHRFRDTFAVELLLQGVPLERVSILLGHSSIRVTEKHYSPWVRSRQEQLEADVRRTWGADTVIAAEAKGTRRVHGKRQPIN